MPPLSTDMLTLVNAAAEFGLQPATLRVLIRNERLMATKLGRDWFVTRRAMREYMENRAPQEWRRSR
jgi:hypothetical protein